MDDKTSGEKASVGRMLATQADKTSAECGVKDRPDLLVETGESVMLSYDSSRFRHCYREMRPRTVDEVRTLIGVHPDVAERGGAGRGGCGCAKAARLVGEVDLDSDDERVRGSALSLTRATVRGYVMGASTVPAAQKSVLDRYIQLTVPILHIAFLQDITVNNGATLHVAANTHAVYARKIRIHGTGRIVCVGPTTFNCSSVEGDYHRRTIVFTPSVGLTAR